MKWETKSLGEVCEIYQPKTISGKEMVDDGAYLVYGANGVIGRYDRYNHEEPQLLITCRGATCGAVNVSTPKVWITGNAMVVRPKNGGLDMRFLEYLFRGGVDLSKTITGAAQPQITRQALSPLEISYPNSLPEQQRIVGKLDAAFAALSAAVGLVERNRANARELFESYLNGVFERKGDGWVEKQLTDVARIRTGKVDANHQAGDGKYAFYTCAFGQFKSPTWSFEGPSVILPGNGANVGVTFFYDGRFEAYQRTYVVNEFGAEVNPRYAYFCFRAGWKPYIATRQFGSATNYIVLGDLKQFPVHLPSLKEQAILLGEFEEMEQHVLELETTYQQKLSDLDALKKGLLGAAFRGEL